MDDDRLERLLKGYRLPDVSSELDHRVLREGDAILARAYTRATLVEIVRDLLDRFGFGYLAWCVDFITRNDAEYGVEFI